MKGKTEYSGESIDVKLKKIFQRENANVEEMAECFIGCQFLIDENEDRVHKLYDKKGLFAKILDFITGDITKNKKFIIRNQHEIQKYALAVQKCLLENQKTLKENILTLNTKLNVEILDRKRIEMQVFDIEKKLMERVKLIEWLSIVGNKKTIDDQLYTQIPKNRALLYVISDFFYYSNGNYNIHDKDTEARLLTVFKNVKIPKTKKISLIEWFNDIIYGNKVLPLSRTFLI